MLAVVRIFSGVIIHGKLPPKPILAIHPGISDHCGCGCVRPNRADARCPMPDAPACHSREASLHSPLADDVVQWRADQIRDGDGAFTLESNPRFDFRGYAVCAEQMILDHNASKLQAIGHVTMFEPNGSIIGAERLILTDAFRAAFIRAVSAHSKRQSTLANIAYWRITQLAPPHNPASPAAARKRGEPGSRR